MRDYDIRFAAPASVSDSQCARLGEFHGFEIRIFGYVRPAFEPEITQQAKFATAAGFAGSHEDRPTVVV